MNTLQIDIKKVLEQKNPFLAKIPFLVFLLKRLIHERGINDCLRSIGNVSGTAFAAAAPEYFDVHVETKIKGSLSPNGRYVFVGNHPLGGLDGLAFAIAISNIYPDIRFPVNDILLSIKGLEEIFIPINKHGGQTKKGVSEINEAYASPDKQILMFPAGLCSREINGNIVDLEWKPNFVKNAIRYERDVVPVYITGKNKNWFYWVANWRERIGIKSNIEMLLLPDQVFRQKSKSIIIKIGEPISYDNLKSHLKKLSGKTVAEKTVAEKTVTDFIRQEVYKMR